MVSSRIVSPIPEGTHFLVERFEEPERHRPLHNRLRRNSRRKGIRRTSKGLKAEQTKYRQLAKQFLALPENRVCICCTLRREQLGENILLNPATEIHHWAGRIKKLLCYVPYFRAFCYHCREWPHQNKMKARELGLLAPAHLWEVFPGDY
jgi:hypothetical protein